MNLTEAEDIKKRWQNYAEELYKKDIHDPDNHDGMITHLEPDILECEVKWALGSITTCKASGGDGIPAQLFQVLKDDAVKVLHSICQQIWPLSSGHRTGKGGGSMLVGSLFDSDFGVFNSSCSYLLFSQCRLHYFRIKGYFRG